MSIYDIIVKKIKDIRIETDEEGPLTNVSTSSMLAGEIAIVSTLLLAVIMLRVVSKVLMIFAFILLLVLVVVAMPVMPKLKREQNDSLANMTFYVVVALGIIITLFYWGNLNV